MYPDLGSYVTTTGECDDFNILKRVWINQISDPKIVKQIIWGFGVADEPVSTRLFVINGQYDISTGIVKFKMWEKGSEISKGFTYVGLFKDDGVEPQIFGRLIPNRNSIFQEDGKFTENGISCTINIKKGQIMVSFLGFLKKIDQKQSRILG